MGLVPDAAHAQGIDGYVAFSGNVMPNMPDDAPGSVPLTELRARLFMEARRTVKSRFRFTFAGFAEGLYSDRTPDDPPLFGIAQPQELHVEWYGPKADLRVGLSRVVWGRLDELQPTDVVNPLDAARFFLEGRIESRIAVPMVRGRLLPTDRFNVEVIYVPIFQRARFDRLDEETSPFNLTPRNSCDVGPATPCLPVQVTLHEPERTTDNAQGGARVSVTSGRVDWAVSAFRGFESQAIYEPALLFVPSPGSPIAVDARFPRYTMVGGDFETVFGGWGLRGEVAGFPSRTWQTADAPIAVTGSTFEGGVGVDRKAGEYRISGNVLWTHRSPDRFAAAGLENAPLPAELASSSNTVNLIAVVDRSFARQTRSLRTFAVYNPTDSSVFARVIATVNVQDNVAFEASGGLFHGDGLDLLSRYTRRDFAYLRLKFFF